MKEVFYPWNSCNPWLSFFVFSASWRFNPHFHFACDPTSITIAQTEKRGRFNRHDAEDAKKKSTTEFTDCADGIREFGLPSASLHCLPSNLFVFLCVLGVLSEAGG